MNGQDRIQINEGITGLVFVEGSDDIAFFKILIEKLGLKSVLQIIPLGGGDRNRLKSRLELIKTDPLYDELATIGIVWDADEHRDRREQSLKAVLQEVPLTPKVSYLIMPPSGEGTDRMLEDVLWRYFEEKNDPLLDCVDQYIQALVALPQLDGKPIWPTHREAKTRFYALIAAQKDPTDEATSDTFRRFIKDWESPVFNDLKVFLTQLAT